MRTLQKIDFYKILPAILLIGTIALGYITYTNIGKGLIFNDEAYYLSYYNSDAADFSFDRTNFFRIFKFLYTPDIHQFRINTITALILSNFVLFYAVLKYFKIGKHPIFYSLIGVFVAFFTWSITNISLQQYIGNTILVNVGLSLLLFSFLLKKKFILTIAGFVFAFVLFNGTTHTVTLIPITIFLWLLDKKSAKINLLLYFLGFLIGIGFYFTFLDSIGYFADQLSFFKEYLTFHRKQHSRTFMVMWVVYLFLNAILPVLITYFLLWKAKFSVNAFQILDKVIAVVGLLTLLSFIIPNQFGYIVLILFTHLLVTRYWFQKGISKENKFVITLLLVIPYGLTFGSQTWFHLRLHVYLIYYFLLIFICFKQLYQNYLWILGYSFFFIYCTFTFPGILNEKGWKDFVFKEQTEIVKVNGYDLYLDKGRKKDLEDLRPYLENQPNVIYSSNHLIGYLYILKAKPPVYYYFTLKDYIQFMIKKAGKTPDDYIYIESDDYPFYPKEIVPLQFVKHPENYQTVQAGRFTLYLPQTFQKK